MLGKVRLSSIVGVKFPLQKPQLPTISLSIIYIQPDDSWTFHIVITLSLFSGSRSSIHIDFGIWYTIFFMRISEHRLSYLLTVIQLSSIAIQPSTTTFYHFIFYYAVYTIFHVCSDGKMIRIHWRLPACLQCRGWMNKWWGNLIRFLTLMIHPGVSS